MPRRIEYRLCQQTLLFLRLPDGSLFPLELLPQFPEYPPDSLAVSVGTYNPNTCAVLDVAKA